MKKANCDEDRNSCSDDSSSLNEEESPDHVNSTADRNDGMLALFVVGSLIPGC